MKPGNRSIRLYPWLAPFSLLYGAGVRFRNWLFDRNYLPAEQFPVPVICIGNLAVGGTGKTPHTEYLIRLLSDRYRVAVVSRGYKRKTKGFVLATAQTRSEELGDEPYQMKRKFPSLILAVDSNRRRAIRTLLELPEKERPEVVLLDDALQHRYVTPSLTLLLTDYRRLYPHDRLLPAGRLREPAGGRERADAILVTKCDPSLPPERYQAIRTELDVSPHQSVFFTEIVYGSLLPVFENGPHKPERITPDDAVVLVSGIASPAPLIEEIGKHTQRISIMNFPDHHLFNKRDMHRIREAFDRLDGRCKRIVVTEKDAVRLLEHPDIEEAWKSFFYYLPITVGFCQKGEKDFRQLIFNHIQGMREETFRHDGRFSLEKHTGR